MPIERVRRLSSAVFGHRYRLELLAALVTAGDKGICVTTLAAKGRAATSVFYPPLKVLRAAGLVRRAARTGDRHVYYAATDDAAWTGIRRMVQDLGLGADDHDEAGVVKP
ncbi:ArsR family transcriptional regulator [Micromonospora zhanjiangensis]|uniref:ArsR family transcriptional regulator n=1 Tax=Micromonospora zhanjiangensis TaxID=1522057 RepID=A0ABV8KUY9_9ACTN